jgi:pimeloyl-ACP methyl ester carboxylesterase
MSIQQTEGLQNDMTASELWFESDGTRLFAVEAGRGRPVVLLHGGLADHRAMSFRLSSLAATHRLLMPDLRGSGRSIHRGALSWDRLADDVAALLGQLGLERAVVGGISMGSGVALRFALRHPDRLQGLILLSPVYPGQDRALAEASNAAMRTLGEAGERVLEHGVEALRPLFEALPPPVRDVAVAMMRDFDAGSVAATTRFLASGAQPMASVSELEAIGVPVLLVPGTDPQHPAEIAELYARHLRQPVLVAPNEADLAESVARYCDALDWGA